MYCFECHTGFIARGAGREANTARGESHRDDTSSAVFALEPRPECNKSRIYGTRKSGTLTGLLCESIVQN